MPQCADIQVEPCRSNDREAGIMATGTPPAGEPYGISTATTDALNTKNTAYENVIGAPASARSTRKAKTAGPFPHFPAVDGLMEGMDDLIIQFAGTGEKDLYFDGHFTPRRLRQFRGKRKAAEPPRRRITRPRRGQ
jgi:hypothetical protein